MRRALLCLLALLISACGSSSTPTAPTVATTPPAPVYPNLVAGWSGTATIGAVSGGQSASNICQTTWVISAQTAGSFAGTYQLSGGTAVPCGQSASVQGTVGTDGQVSIAFSPNQSTVPAGCTVLNGTPLTGVVTGTAMTLQQTTHLTCNGAAVDQTASIALTKR